MKGIFRAVLTPTLVSSNDILQFGLSHFHGRVETYMGIKCVRFSRPTAVVHLSTETETKGYGIWGATTELRDILRFCKAFGTPPLSLLALEYEREPKSRYNADDIVETLIAGFGGAELDKLESLPSVEPDTPSVRSLEIDYNDWNTQANRVPHEYKKVREALRQQEHRYGGVPTKVFSPSYLQAEIRLHSPAVAFLYHFANYTFKFKPGDSHVTYDFDVKRVLEAVQEKQFDLKQLEVETGDAIVPVGLVDGSAFICIGLTGWFYQAEYRSTDGKVAGNR